MLRQTFSRRKITPGRLALEVQRNRAIQMSNFGDQLPEATLLEKLAVRCLAPFLSVMIVSSVYGQTAPETQQAPAAPTATQSTPASKAQAPTTPAAMDQVPGLSSNADEV